MVVGDVSLCDAYPTLFDLIDESPSYDIDTVEKVTITRLSTNATCVTCVTKRNVHMFLHTLGHLIST